MNHNTTHKNNEVYCVLSAMSILYQEIIYSIHILWLSVSFDS